MSTITDITYNDATAERLFTNEEAMRTVTNPVTGAWFGLYLYDTRGSGSFIVCIADAGDRRAASSSSYESEQDAAYIWRIIERDIEAAMAEADVPS